MKHPIWVVLGILGAGTPATWAQDKGGPLMSPVELELRNDSRDAQLIKLARAAKINVMADASDEPGDGAPVARAGATLSVAKKQTLLEWLRDISYANRMTWQRNEGSTVVLWPKPNIAPLARRMADGALAQRPQIEAEIMPALRAALDPALVARLDAEPEKWSQAIGKYGLYGIVVTDSLLSLLKDKHGWDGQDANFRLQLQDEQIPAELRSQIILYRRLSQARPKPAEAVWLRDETWKNARLIVQQSQPMIINGKPEPRRWSLSVATQVGGEETTKSVATLSVEGEGAQ